jgi:CHAT domain-containing protein
MFAPHQTWHLFPLHLIQIDNESLCSKLLVRYIPSLQILRLITNRKQANSRDGCIIADPDTSLPAAREEGNIILKYRSRDVLLYKDQATLENVRQQLAIAQQSHFACHGYFAPDLNAGLHLFDGKLIAKELFISLRLPNARIVVLSACETAQIKPTIADEYMGLVSGFLFSGSHNVLASLWKVDDLATLLLMRYFYKGLSDGLSLTQALQQAQQWLQGARGTELSEIVNELYVQSGKKNQELYNYAQNFGKNKNIAFYRSPYFWSGFILVGDGL